MLCVVGRLESKQKKVNVVTSTIHTYKQVSPNYVILAEYSLLSRDPLL